jgi:hypothetical protein
LPEFFGVYNIPKWGNYHKVYPMEVKYAIRLLKNVKMAIKFSIPRPTKINENWDFLV